MFKSQDYNAYLAPESAEACRKSIDELLEPARHDLPIDLVRTIGSILPGHGFAEPSGTLWGHKGFLLFLAGQAGYETYGEYGKGSRHGIRKCRIKLPFVVEGAYQAAAKIWGHYRPADAANEFRHYMRTYGYPVRFPLRNWKVLASLATAAERLAYIEELLLIQGKAR